MTTKLTGVRVGNIKSKLIISNSIHVLRAEKRLSQQQLAEAIGVTRATVNALEGGNYNPSLELAFRLARFFELNLNDIFKVEGERHE